MTTYRGFGLAHVKKEGHSWCAEEPEVDSWPSLTRERHKYYTTKFSPLVRKMFGRIFKPIVEAAWDEALQENARKGHNDDTN